MGLKDKIHEVIFEADTPAGKAFDIFLLIAIVISIVVVMLESVPSIEQSHGILLRRLEWFFTLLFTAEYLLRIAAVGRPTKYIFSFFGLVDLLSILPTLVSIFVTGAQSLLVIRTLRLLRVFRVLKLARYVGGASLIMDGLRASRPKIIVFLTAVLSTTVIMGTLMYLIESEESGFTSIPRSIYWAIVTLTTVGYGDIAPQTVLGQALASIIMILGYGIIAVPTGIVTANMVAGNGKDNVTTRSCPECSLEGHDEDAEHCKFCGSAL